MKRLLCSLGLTLALTACMTDDDGGLADEALSIEADDAAEPAAIAFIPFDGAPWSLPSRIAPRTPVHLRDPEVATGRSCLTCHVNGPIVKADQVRDRRP